MTNIGFQMHGVKMNLHCSHHQFIHFIQMLFEAHVCTPFHNPDLTMHIDWQSTQQTKSFDTTGLNAYGKRMYISDEQLVWHDTYRTKNLQLRFRKDHSSYVFDILYHYQPTRKKLEKYPDYEQKKYFDLLRYVIWYPLSWYLERTKQWILMHASAVANEDRGILIAGPGGAGKTTTCLALIARAGMEYISENLLYTNAQSIHSTNEPVRLTEESVNLLGKEIQKLNAFGPENILKKKSMFLPKSPCDGVAPAILFFTQFSPKGFIERIRPDVACEYLLATNHLTLELNDYYWYSAALDLLWPNAGRMSVLTQTIQKITEEIPCYVMGIDKKKGIDPVVDNVLNCMEGAYASC